MKNDETKNQNVNLAELCKIQYAHFVVLKMIKYCGRDEESIKLIVKVGCYREYVCMFNNFLIASSRRLTFFT